MPRNIHLPAIQKGTKPDSGGDGLRHEILASRVSGARRSVGARKFTRDGELLNHRRRVTLSYIVRGVCASARGA